MYRISNRQKWQEIVDRLDEFDGSVTDFCRQERLSVRALNYWRVKLRDKAQSSVNLPSVKSYKDSSFCRVEVEDTRSLPDPKWLAELILHLQAKGSSQ